MIKLVAIDLDGTLLNDEGKLSLNNLKALYYAEEKGAKVVITTGRPYITTKEIVEEIGLKGPSDYLITFNGGQIQKARDGELLVGDTLSKKEVITWYEELSRVELPMNLIDQQMVYEPLRYPINVESYYLRDISQAPSQKIDFYDFDAEHRFNKIIVSTEEKYLEEKLLLINEKLSDDYNLSYSFPHLLEISGLGISKASALEKLTEKLEIKPEQVMAIGDQINDLSMMAFAGVSVAVENAIPEIKQLADFITSTNNEDGVARAIYTFIK